LHSFTERFTALALVNALLFPGKVHGEHSRMMI
jgi:hypothetical protein